MIGQQIGLRWLVPLALDVLEHNALVSGDYYEGDLLKNVLQIDKSLWHKEPSWRDRTNRILAGLVDIPSDLINAIQAFNNIPA